MKSLSKRLTKLLSKNHWEVNEIILSETLWASEIWVVRSTGINLNLSIWISFSKCLDDYADNERMVDVISAFSDEPEFPNDDTDTLISEICITRKNEIDHSLFILVNDINQYRMNNMSLKPFFIEK